MMDTLTPTGRGGAEPHRWVVPLGLFTVWDEPLSLPPWVVSCGTVRIKQLYAHGSPFYWYPRPLHRHTGVGRSFGTSHTRAPVHSMPSVLGQPTRLRMGWLCECLGLAAGYQDGLCE